MSSINFDNLVESLLCENILDQLTPKTGDSTLNINTVIGNAASIEAIVGGSKYQSKDKLISVKPIWPHIDTLAFIFNQLTGAQLIPKRTQGLETLQKVLTDKNNFQEVVQELNKNNQLSPEQAQALVQVLQNQFNYFNSNVRDINNFQYTNAVLKTMSDETGTIAAEPYLDLTPQESIVKVLQDFGGYDTRTAEKIVMYPAENRYTQMGQNIEGVVMGSIIQISKLLLIFYREYIQKHAQEIANILTSQSEQEITPEELDKVVQRVNQSSAVVGKEAAPSDSVAKAIHGDYIRFLNGMSNFVLEDYSAFSPEPVQQKETSRAAPRVSPPGSRGPRPASLPAGAPPPPGTNVNASLNLFDKFYNKVFINEQEQVSPLIKSINDFSAMPGTGQRVYQAYIHLFNNMKKGEVPSKWETGTKIGMDVLGSTIGGIASTLSKFRGF